MGNVGLVARNIGLLIVGVMVSFVGVVNMTGDVRTIKKYHRLRVRAEDIPKYGRAHGIGGLIMGLSCIAGFIASLWSETLMALIILPCVAIGLGFMLYAQLKYNGGIF